ncbi:MAG: translation initiation factor IF-3 [Fimbriimonadaceae bacterium]|nr:translation initiation factor IF-3 [Fimbriimonadaceae bacterium]QYK55507.1 MAG: translation initiation factor IF-3 [Fimbriimonadaceae bacterium]
MVDAEGQQSGVLTTREALNQAREAGLDLVLVAPHAQPPVARIVDWGKYKYEKDKREKESKKASKGKQEVKGVKVSPNIAEHDLATQTRKTRSFLLDGDKVRIVCRFRQRELAHPNVGRDKIQSIINAVEDIGKPDKEPTLSGREMVVVINPKPPAKAKESKGPAEPGEGAEPTVMQEKLEQAIGAAEAEKPVVPGPATESEAEAEV